MPEKIPSLLTDAKNAVGGNKNIPLTGERESSGPAYAKPYAARMQKKLPFLQCINRKIHRWPLVCKKYVFPVCYRLKMRNKLSHLCTKYSTDCSLR